ncbi:hypothetical protein RG2014_05 [Delftia phage RG-2014]|uniref:Uncharacterized protein n=1 Tax=Delftia phage RG-2014 TaxID=1563661 RepID=A0A097PAK6_9CAUD|nr:hypothetical protein RG2014_05 [Delftia phage RG-2014]AIU44258.1 hypothetical protein RG2014_05 [Delftia phage RG-2014]
MAQFYVQPLHNPNSGEFCTVLRQMRHLSMLGITVPKTLKVLATGRVEGYQYTCPSSRRQAQINETPVHMGRFSIERVQTRKGTWLRYVNIAWGGEIHRVQIQPTTLFID